MHNEPDNQNSKSLHNASSYRGDGQAASNSHADRYRDEVFSKRVPAGKRTYFFDVKATRSGEDFFLTITESKRLEDGRYEKHKIFLYKEDFGKFISALHESVGHIKDECLPDYDFDNLPDLTTSDDGAEYTNSERDY